MKVAVKYLILIVAFIGAFTSFSDKNNAGITAAGAFIAYALIEIYDLKLINEKEE